MEREEIQMTDDEFNVLDELYFVQSFEELVKLSGYDPDQLVPIISSLFDQGYIKIFKNMDDEWTVEELTKECYPISFFLATKKGLLAHNS